MIAPTAALVIAALAWSAAWAAIRTSLLTELTLLRGGPGDGWDWRTLAVTGYPFRLDVAFTDLVWRDRTGWSLSAPDVRAEALAFLPGRWMVAAPRGGVLARRRGGRVAIEASSLRASLADLTDHPPSLTVEARQLAFRAPAGADPFFVTRAQRVQLSLRALPGEEAEAALVVEGAAPRVGGLFAQVAAGRMIDLFADLSYDKAPSGAGPDWATAVRAWRAAGGRATLRRLRILAGPAELDSQGGSFGVDREGRLEGSLTTSLRQAPRTLETLGRAGALAPETARTAAQVAEAAGAPEARVTIDFQAGRATLGPADLGHSPKVY